MAQVSSKGVPEDSGGVAQTSVLVRLTPKELKHAIMIGVDRRIRSWAKGLREKNDGGVKALGSDIQRDAHGAIGEYAVAKHFNLGWSGAWSKTTYDVGHCLEVRTISKPNHRLWFYESDAMYKSDSRDVPFVLAYYSGSGFVVKLTGWTTWEMVEDEVKLTDPGTGRAAYYVDNSLLKPLRTLKIEEWKARKNT